MQTSELYQVQHGLWDGLLRREPAAWSKERAQYLSLLQAGLVEEFISLVSDSLPLFAFNRNVRRKVIFPNLRYKYFTNHVR